MTDYDVVVIGAGAAGLPAGALLAAEGKRVLVADRSPVLGGRAMAVPDEGFKVNVGGHLIEDPGSGLTKVFEHVGKELIHGTVSAEMPVCCRTSSSRRRSSRRPA
jgi:phytoene dehydrogenase-like protein